MKQDENIYYGRIRKLIETKIKKRINKRQRSDDR